jgi:phage/plasmid-like protein (TIGR03299 family)
MSTKEAHIMAHEFETGFFVGKAAWHRLGTVVQDAPKVEDAIQLAGLDWKVVERPVLYEDSFGDFYIHARSHKVLVRPSDDYALGVVGEKYKPLQNEEAFTFFNPILEQGGATLEAAGSLRYGKRIWVLAKLQGATAEITKGDEVVGYLLLSNSHDGSSAVRVQFTAVRVVCMNTLSAAERRGDDAFEHCVRIRHTRGLPEALKEVRKALDLTNRTFSFSVEAYQRLASKGITVDGLKNYVREVLEATDSPAMPLAWDWIQASYELGPGADLPGVRGTYWGAYNAVTHWLGTIRGKSDESRLDSVWFGSGRQIADRALKVALAAVN